MVGFGLRTPTFNSIEWILIAELPFKLDGLKNLSIPLNGFSLRASTLGRVLAGSLSIPLNGFSLRPLQLPNKDLVIAFNSIEWIPTGRQIATETTRVFFQFH